MLRPLFIVILLLTLSSALVFAQKTTLDADQRKTIDGLNRYCGAKVKPDPAVLLKRIDSVEQAANANNNKAYFLDAELVKAAWLVRQTNPANDAKILALLQSIQQEATDNHIEYINARAEERLGHFYSQGLHLEQMFDHWQKQLAISSHLKNPDDGGIFGLAPTLYHLGDMYYYYGEYRNSATYFRQLIPRLTKTTDPYMWRQSYNTIAYDYRKLNMLDSSDYYFKLGYQWATNNNNPDWQAINNDGLGINLYLKKRYDAAIPLLQQNVNQSVKRNDWWSACGSLLILADIALKRNQLQKADSILKIITDRAEKGHQPLRSDFLPIIYPLLAKLYAAKGDKNMAQRYVDSTVSAKDKVNRQANEAHLLRMQERIEVIKQNEEIIQAVAEAKAKKLERNLLIAIICILLISALFFYRLQIKRHQQKQLIKELELKQKETDLTSAKDQLQELLTRMAEKNKIIASFDSFLTPDKEGAIAELRKNSLLTESDWDRFKLLFEKVNPGFLDELLHRYPDTSKAEMRFIALAKLQLNNKEIAAMLAISPESVRVTWHRLRKKMQLPAETTLAQLVAGVGI